MDDSIRRNDCQLRHKNGNCLPIGGFCTAVNDDICDALRRAYQDGYFDSLKEAEPAQNVKVETNFFDKEEIFENCTVQVLTNTVTGEVSVGWWQNDSGKEGR